MKEKTKKLWRRPLFRLKVIGSISLIH